MAHDINFWTLVEYDVARQKANDAKLQCYWEYCKAVVDIAALILRLAEDGEVGFQISEGTLKDLRTIVERPDPEDMDYRLSVIDACVPDETEPAFIEAARRDCPHSYEYYRLYRHGVLSLV